MSSAISSFVSRLNTPLNKSMAVYAATHFGQLVLPAPHRIWATRMPLNMLAFIATAYSPDEIVRKKLSLACYVAGCVAYDYLNSSRVNEYAQIANTALYGVGLIVSCAAGIYLHRRQSAER